MISADDLEHLSFTADISEAAIVHLCRNLSRLGSGARITGPYLRRALAATSAQLALRRYLVHKGLDFGVSPPPTFAPHENPNVKIGHRTWVLETFLISDATQIDALEADPTLALQAPALVASDRLAAEANHVDDVLLFALVSATPFAPQGRHRQWMHALHPAWRRPRIWAPLGPLTVKSETDDSVELEIGGQIGAGDFHQIDLEITSGPGNVVDVDFHSISYVRAAKRPVGRIGLRSTARGLSQLIGPAEWEDIWLEGREVCLLGWITRQEFSLRARPVPQGARVFQFGATRVKNLAVEVSSLKPMQKLVEYSRQ